MSIENRQPAQILSELLVLQAQGGSQDALTQIIDIWTPALKSRARRLTRDDEGTLEVLQETWIAIARSLRKLNDPARFGAWSFRIVHHKSADWIKAQSKHRARQTHIRDQANDESDPSQDSGNEIRTAIGHLDPKLRDVVYLFYMDNCTLQQVAVVLGIPEGTAKTRLARARTQLKSMLENNS
mgnify:CR=1 FL=1